MEPVVLVRLLHAARIDCCGNANTFAIIEVVVCGVSCLSCHCVFLH